MSAFCDIWIGSGQKPSFKRFNGSDWQSILPAYPHCLLSAPRNQSIQLIHQASIGEYSLIVLGQFYEMVNITSLAEKCIAYTTGTEKHFNDPAGHYIIFLLNSDTGECHVFTNRFGTYHAYWMSNSSQNVISTCYLGMARQSIAKELDWEGITGFFAMGFFPNDTTYLKNIRILNPANYYHFDSNLDLVKYNRYWNWTHSDTAGLSGDILECLNETMQKSVASAVDGYRTALPISGGLDSRMLAGVVTDSNAYLSAWAYSYGYTSDSVETSIAAQIAKARNLSFSRYVVPNYLFDRLDEVADAVELFQYVDGTRQACMRDALSQNADVVVGGHWGDVWLDNASIDDAEQLPSHFEKKILKRGRQWLLSEIATNQLTDTQDFLQDYFRRAINKYSSIDDIALKFKAFKTDAWSFRWTLASIRMYQAAVFPVLPFYDKNVVDLLLQVPRHVLADRKFQIEFIKKFQPDLARITWQEYGRNLYSYQYFNNRNLVYRGFKKAQRMITGSKPVIRNWEVFYLNAGGKKQLETRLLDHSVLDEFVSVSKRKVLLDDFYKHPTAADGYTVSMLLTFSEALKRIF